MKDNFEEPELKKTKFELEKIEDKMEDNNLDPNLFLKYENDEHQVVVIDLLGRIMWMNNMFKEVNAKFEDGLFESFYDYGFEAFQEIWENVQKNYYDHFEENSIEFVSENY